MQLSPLNAAKPLTPLDIETKLNPLPGSAVRKTAAPASAADVKKAASQFEAIILRQLLKPSIDPMMSGGAGGSAGGGIYGYMLTDTLANSLSAGGGLGLGHMLQKQFGAAAAKPAAAPKISAHS